MMKIFVLFTLLFSLHSFADCDVHFEQYDICGSIQWIKGPSKNERNEFHVTFNNTLSDAALKVDLWMPAMNHGSRAVTLEWSSPTTVKVDKAFFVMNGPWLIRFFLIDSAGNVVAKSETEITI